MPKFGMKTPNRKDDWVMKREQFLKEIAPESHFYRVIDGLPDTYFFVKNRLGQTLFCSANLPHNHGLRSESEMIGKTDVELTPGALADKYLLDDAEIYRTGEPLNPQIEICIDHVGLPNWYRTCKYPVKNRNGKVIGIMGTFQLANIDYQKDPIRGQLEAARSMLGNHLLEFPGIHVLANCSNMSVRNFQRVFKKTFGNSPYTYWMKLRIRAASELLRSKRLSLIQVSSQLGFYDQSSFTKHFRRHVGETPRAFALKHLK
jgi:AraC-like DNA-binding protein